MAAPFHLGKGFEVKFETDLDLESFFYGARGQIDPLCCSFTALRLRRIVQPGRLTAVCKDSYVIIACGFD